LKAVQAAVTPRGVLLLTLAAGLLARLALIQAGGQLYWGDEFRCLESREIVRDIAAGELKAAAHRLHASDHPLFRVVSMVPAAVELVAGVEDTRIAATFLAAFGVFNLWIVGRIAGRLGASAWSCTLASVLAGLSASLTYWSRHLVPYDVALSLALLAVYVGVHPRADARTSVRCGLLAASAFLVYNGYWAVAATAGLVHAARGRDGRDFASRTLGAARGFAALICLLLAYDAALGGGYVSNAAAFARTAIQGAYEEGARLPFVYFWHTEQLVLVAWLSAAAWALVQVARGRSSALAQVGLLGALGVYACLAGSSVTLRMFVVYGRLARQIAPFLCLVAADGFETLRSSPKRGLRAVFAAVAPLLLVQAGANFTAHLRQVFPREFLLRAAWYANCGPGYGPVLALNADSHHPLPLPVALPERYQVVEEARHPRQWLPYQLEGTSPEERALVARSDIRMRLVLPLMAPPADGNGSGDGHAGESMPRCESAPQRVVARP
jgi:hypothetical protein